MSDSLCLSHSLAKRIQTDEELLLEETPIENALSRRICVHQCDELFTTCLFTYLRLLIFMADKPRGARAQQQSAIAAREFRSIAMSFAPFPQPFSLILHCIGGNLLCAAKPKFRCNQHR